MASKTLLIGQRIALGFAVSLLALMAIGYFSLRNLEEIQRDAGLVGHTIEVQSEVKLLDQSFSRIESAGRGYLLSGADPIKAEFTTQRRIAEASLRKLQFLTVDNASQQLRLVRLETLLNNRLTAAQDTMALRDHGQLASPRKVYSLVLQGQDISDEFRALAAAVGGEETRLLGVRQEASRQATALARNSIIYGSAGAFVFVLVCGYLLTRSVTGPLERLRRSAARIGQGDYAHRVEVRSDDEVGQLGRVFNEMTQQVEQRQAALAAQDWVKTGVARFTAFFQNQRDPLAIGHMVLGELATLIEARHSLLYRLLPDGPGQVLQLCASYAAHQPPQCLAVGEGLVGQGAAENRRAVLAGVPPGYLRINSALGAAPAAAIVIQPVAFEGQVKAVLEVASLQAFSPLQLELLDRVAASLGVALQNIESIARTEDLLQQSQALTAQLEEQQVELEQTNEELTQTNEEMEQANEEMEEKTNLLAEQSRQLKLSSTYKSNFLATMSHELRTPLNSLLILARLLGENRDANLTAKQVQFARTIESSGADLLEMINQILDLAKIESGTVELQLDDVLPGDLQRSLEDQFRPVADAKRLDFSVQLAPELPERIHTDVGRLYQVLKNLLANAFKFTERGSVRAEVRVATGGWTRSSDALNHAAMVVAFAVTDTGIGIPREKQEIIFESFQQADAGTARRFGGTGLGLSISREIAALLGGALQLESDAGKGSTFTLFIPARLASPSGRVRGSGGHPPEPAASAAAPAAAISDEIAPEASEREEPGVSDDRAGIVAGDRVLLIIEDDLAFAHLLVDFAREKHFKALVARTGRRGLALAKRFLPAAITLDLHLADEDGWLVLDRLKHDGRTSHIPVHVISVDDGRTRGLKLGAVSYLQKPATKEAIDEILKRTIDFIERPVKNLLVVEDDAVQRRTICELIGNGDVHTTAVGTAAEALAVLAREHFDCIVMDLILPDQAGADLIREINRRLGLHSPPVIVYTGKDLSRREETELRSLSESIIVKDARSPERLLDETALFLHRVQARLPEAKRRMLEQVRRQDALLTGRRVLIVDDDVRNIFALTAALENYGMTVQFAESGQAAIERLQGGGSFDVVLMDIMMPEMDGNEVIRRLRRDGRFARLPIIAVTAKAMKGDRERSIEAGASDYITKPVDTEKLISLLRVWLYQ